MKKLLFVLVALIVGGAQADNIVTSREYVDTQANTLQNTLPAKNTNTVLLNTDTAGEVGEKAIYDASAAFGAQTDALVTAGTFNTAVQNALDSEFVCIERQNGNGGCLLYEIRSATPATTNKIANGYTQLEYLESTGTQYINTNIIPNTNYSMQLTLQPTVLQNSIFAGTRGGNAFTRSFAINAGNNSTVYYVEFGDAGNINVGRLDTNKHTIKVSKSGFIVDGISTARPFNDFDSTTSVYLFACNSFDSPSLGASVKIYNAKICNQDALVGNFIPARRDSDNALGMYDTVSGTFFTNAGTGDFIAGPVVSSNLYLPSGQ